MNTAAKTVCLFDLIWFFTSHQQSFSFIGTGLPGLNQYWARINVSCSRTTTQWRRWGSNLRPFDLESSTLPLSHCAPYEKNSTQSGVLQHCRRYIYEFPWKASLSSMGETNVHLTNTFKDELTSYLKQYTLCNAIDSSISLLHLHGIHKRGILCKLQMFCILYISCSCTP